jgi:hypothetical protein
MVRYIEQTQKGTKGVMYSEFSAGSESAFLAMKSAGSELGFFVDQGDLQTALGIFVQLTSL